MKKLTYLVLCLAFFTPVLASASTVLYVKQNIDVTHGTMGIVSEDFGSILISFGDNRHGAINMVGQGKTDISLGDSTIYPVPYTVTPGYDPRGIFVPTLGENCTGTVAQDASTTCEISWSDTGPNSGAPSVASQPAPTSISAPTAAAPLLTVPASEPVLSATTSPEEQANIEQLQLIISLLKQILELLKEKIALQSA